MMGSACAPSRQSRDFVAFAAQRVAQAEADMGVVFHDEDVLFHFGFRISDFGFSTKRHPQGEIAPAAQVAAGKESPRRARGRAVARA